MANENVEKILQIVAGMSDPSVPNSTRMQAYQACEEFKKSLLPASKSELGYILAKNADRRWSVSVVHFGLQLLEETIKFSWPSIPADLKNTIKNMTVDIISSLSESQFLILDGAAKLLVEIIKREWPQQYPNMLPEMGALSSRGPLQMQTVVLVFLRFIEDLVQFRSLPSARQRDITEALTAVMPEFVTFLVRCLEQSSLSSTSIMIIRLCLALGEFAQIKYLWEKDGILFDMLLFRTINEGDQELQLEVAEFIHVLLSRKYPKREEVNIVLQLFTKENYFVALVNVLERTKSPGEVSIMFRKMCDVFAALAAQMVQLVDIPLFIKQNTMNFRKFLEILRALTEHQNPIIGNTMLTGWLAFWGNKSSRVDGDVQATAPYLLQKCCEFAVLHKLSDNALLAKEFTHQEELFREFVTGYRVKISELVRRISAVLPKESLEYAFGVVRLFLSKEETNQNAWSAVLTLLDGTTRFLPAEIKTEFRNRAAQLAYQLMDVDGAKGNVIPFSSVAVGLESAGFGGCAAIHQAAQHFLGKFEAPGITSLRLSLISKVITGFFPNPPAEHESLALEAVDRAINHNFYILSATLPETGPRDEPREELHLHARNLFTSFSRTLSRLLVLRYDNLLAKIRVLFDSGKLGTDDRCVLLDGLITVTKDCPDVGRKVQLCSEIITAVTPFWMSSEFKQAVLSGANFLAFCGLDKPLLSTIDDPELMQRRSQVLFCAHVIATTFMCMKFSGPEAHVLLENAFLLVRCFMQFQQPEVVAVIPKESQNVLAMSDSETEALLKTVFVVFPENPDSSSLQRSAVRRMQNWLHNVFESVSRVIGFAGRCFGAEFYKIPELPSSLDNSFLQYVSTGTIPMFRIRTLVKEQMAHFIRNCPLECAAAVLVPSLKVFCPAVAALLNNAWNSLDVESDEKTEILRSVVVRAFTKDYANLILQRILCDRMRDSETAGEQMQDEEMIDDDSEEDSESTANKPKVPPKAEENASEISALGLLCLQDSELTNAILSTVFNGLWWPDSTLSVQFVRFAQILLPKLSQKSSVLATTENVSCVLYCILSAFRNHGQHDANQVALISFGLHAYFLLRPVFPLEVENMLKSGEVDVEKQDMAIKQLDNQLFNKPDIKGLQAKSRRDAFKRVMMDHIGKPVSTLQKLEVFIPNIGVAGKKKPGLLAKEINGDVSADLSGLFTARS